MSRGWSCPCRGRLSPLRAADLHSPRRELVQHGVHVLGPGAQQGPVAPGAARRDGVGGRLNPVRDDLVLRPMEFLHPVM